MGRRLRRAAPPASAAFACGKSIIGHYTLRAGTLMRLKAFMIVLCAVAAGPSLLGQQWPFPARPLADPLPPLSPTLYDAGIKAMVERLELEKYKATIKGLTQFGDRRQGTD